MIKKLTFILLAAGCTQIMYAQSTEKNEKFLENKTLFEELTNVKKKQDKFNLFLNMQGSFDANFRDGFEEGAFKMRQLRIEAKGNINNWLSYRYRQRLNRSNDSSGNIENMSNFMTGLNIGYDINAHQQLNLQILDSRNGSFNKTYGVETEDGEQPNIESGKLPLVYTLNWNGNFNDVFKTRWSASIMNEAKDKNLYYFAFGNELNLNKFNMFLDFMYSKEGIDRKGIMTGITGSMEGHNAFDAGYFSMVTKLNYRFLPKWNAFVKGMYETASLTKQQGDLEKGKYRTAWGYFAGVEFYPMDTNLHFFLTYVGRSYDFTARAKALGQENYSTNRVSVGFIYQLPMF